MDAAPADADGEEAGSPGGRMSNGESPTYAASRGLGAEALEREQERLGVGLVPLGLVCADDDVEEPLDRQPREREVDRDPALRRDDPEARPSAFSVVEHVVDPGAALELSCCGSLCAR